MRDRGIPFPKEFVKGIPKAEIIWETYHATKATYYVTSKIDRTQYFLYKLIDNKAEKIGRAANPVVLKEKYLD